mgnify:FL=1
MDILHLVDRLEELFNESPSIWFTHSIIVNEDRMYDLINQMRMSVPEEVKKAEQVLAQRDRILAQAQEEAARTIALAKDKSQELVARDPIIQAAQDQAKRIVEQADQERANTKLEADQYIIESLRGLDAELERLLYQVRNGIAALGGDVQTNSPEEVRVPQPARDSS